MQRCLDRQAGDDVRLDIQQLIPALLDHRRGQVLVRQLQELPAALHKARALARSGKPVLVNIWLDKTEFREGSLSM